MSGPGLPWAEPWVLQWTCLDGSKRGVLVRPLTKMEPPSVTKRRLILAARAAGWTPPRWWQWWRWSDTRVAED